MTPVEPRIAILSFSNPKASLNTSCDYSWFAKGFEVHYFNYNVNLDLIPTKFNAVVTIGPKSLFKNINNNLPTLNLEDSSVLSGDLIYDFYVKSSLRDKNPTISIFTPTYNTFSKFDRVFKSVINQSFKDWEWIILDDSDSSENYNYIQEKICGYKNIKLYKCNQRDGFVGSTKRQAASLCNGDYLLELDHDDELHHLALEYIASAFKKFPDAGFAYSNSCETFEDGGNVNYGSNFGMGFGRHYSFNYKGRNLLGADTPINASTIRHIVGVPNHIRCWKRELYFQIMRHNNKLSIVDDYEILIRTFLYTKMIHIREVLYIQYMNSGGSNTQEMRRAEIQRLVDKIQKLYDSQIHDRILELGGTDWLWNENKQEGDIYKNFVKEWNTLAYVY